MALKTFKFEVFGRRVLVAQSDIGWVTFYLGDDGKRRSAPDIVLPPDLPESEITQYLGDLCHEWETDRYPDVRQLD